MAYQSGRHFLQIPGPTNVPDRVLRAMAAPTIDHRGPAFAALARQVLADLGWLCGTARLVPDEGYRATGRVFRIGHLGDLGDVSPAGARCGVEMGLARAGVPIARSGVSAALDYLGQAA